MSSHHWILISQVHWQVMMNELNVMAINSVYKYSCICVDISASCPFSPFTDPVFNSCLVKLLDQGIQL
jgi:hypothetical protein